VSETNHHDASALNAIGEVALKYFRLRGPDAALLGRAPDIDEPISSEIFSVERLEQYAAILRKRKKSRGRTRAPFPCMRGCATTPPF